MALRMFFVNISISLTPIIYLTAPFLTHKNNYGLNEKTMNLLIYLFLIMGQEKNWFLTIYLTYCIK